MFFRSKQTHAGRALQLIESFRDGDGLPRQRIVVSLGGVDVPQDLWKAVASLVETLLRGETLLVPFPQPVQKWASLVLQKIEKKGWKSKSAIKRLAEEKSSEKIDETLVSHHNTVELGPELVAERAWNELNLQQCLVSLRLSSRQILAAKISICNRLIEPCSEHSLTEWLRGTAFSDLLGEDVTRLNDDSFYRISDTLLEHKDSIEKFLVRRETSLFSLRRTVLLYDLSNTYFEGLCQKNPKAARTKASKHQRSDVPSVAFGMVLDGDGFLLRHKMFEGNIGEASTLMEMIQGLSAETDQKPVVIIDGGIASEKKPARPGRSRVRLHRRGKKTN